MVKSWNDITVSQYKKIQQIPKDDDWIWHFITIVEKTTYEEVMNRPLAKSLKSSYEANKFLDKKPDTSKIKYKFNLGGTRYFLQADPDKIQTAQYIDFCNADQKFPDNMAELISIFIIPNGETYGNYDRKKVISDIDNYMGMEDAMSVYHFFTVLFRYLQTRALRKAKKALKQMKKQGVEEKAVNEAIKAITRYQEEQKVLRDING